MKINKLLTHMRSLQEYDLLWAQVHSSILFSWSRVYASYDLVWQQELVWALLLLHYYIYKQIWWVEHEIKFEMQERRRIITHQSKMLILSIWYSFLAQFMISFTYITVAKNMQIVVFNKIYIFKKTLHIYSINIKLKTTKYFHFLKFVSFSQLDINV